MRATGGTGWTESGGRQRSFPTCSRDPRAGPPDQKLPGVRSTARGGVPEVLQRVHGWKQRCPPTAPELPFIDRAAIPSVLYSRRMPRLGSAALVSLAEAREQALANRKLAARAATRWPRRARGRAEAGSRSSQSLGLRLAQRVEPAQEPVSVASIPQCCNRAIQSPTPRPQRTLSSMPEGCVVAMDSAQQHPLLGPAVTGESMLYQDDSMFAAPTSSKWYVPTPHGVVGQMTVEFRAIRKKLTR